MQLKAKLFNAAAGRPIVFLNQKDAEALDVHASGRVVVSFDRKKVTCIVNITQDLVKKGEIGIFNEVKSALKLKQGDVVEVEAGKPSSSVEAIRKRINGKELSYEEFYEIVKDAVEGNLTDIELAAFVTALEGKPLSLEEAANLSLAMIETGEKLELGKKIILDKHSLGGVPGDKTSLMLVPIIAAAGFTIPKTSSRAITSPAGTADRAEALMPVNLDAEEMKRVVEKTNGCIVWGGAVHLAPVDDIFIRIERPLRIDPLFFPSIMAKKKAVGATHLVVDIPTGRGTKIKTIGDAEQLARDFIDLANMLGIKAAVGITYGEQPIGNAIGAALEAREALETIMLRKNTEDLIDKVTSLAGILLELVGKQNGKQIATKILTSGKAERKLREIIAEQGGDPKIKPEDIEIGDYRYDFKAEEDGHVIWLDNGGFVSICRAAGSPRDKGAGVYLYKKLGDSVKKGETVFSIFAKSERKLDDAIKVMEEESVIGIGKRREMLIKMVKEIIPVKKRFILER